MGVQQKIEVSFPPTSAAIESIVQAEKGLEVYFAGEQAPVNYSWFWLRDHGIDAGSLDPETQQRLVDTFDIPTNIRPSNVQISSDLDEINISWSSAPMTKISAQLLTSVEGRTLQTQELVSASRRVLWGNTNKLAAVPSVGFDAIMDGPEGLKQWLENIVVYGFSLIEGVPPTQHATKQLAERIGRIQETIFGGMWTLSAELVDHGDSAYTTQFLQPHTDGSYYHDAPGLQFFNCLEFDGKGGESVQLDGFAIAKRINQEDPEAYQTLSDINVPGQYLEPGVHLHAERPPFRHNAKGELCQVTFNNYDRAPFHLSDEEARRFYHAYGLLNKHVMDQTNWIKIPLRPGTALIFDNWRNLHGRMGYVGKREFYGCYINKAEFESKLRQLQAGY